MYNDRRGGYKTDKKEKLLSAGMKAAIKKGFYGFSTLDVLDYADLQYSTLYYHYKNMRNFKIAVRDEAIRTKNPRLIVQLALLNPPMLGELTLSRSLILQSLERLKEFISGE